MSSKDYQQKFNKNVVFTINGEPELPAEWDYEPELPDEFEDAEVIAQKQAQLFGRPAPVCPVCLQGD